MGSFVQLVGYLILFTFIAASFLLITLLVGRLVRPTQPNAEKNAIYECGEPTIGSSWVQFDLRFYVVALLFVIFDVEVAFFFPWAAVFGEAARVADPSVESRVGLQSLPETARFPAELAERIDYDSASKVLRFRGMMSQSEFATLTELSDDTVYRAAVTQLFDRTAREPLRQLGLSPPDNQQNARATPDTAHSLAVIAFVDLLVFFGVVLVGFAYLWKRGDLDWVRASLNEAQAESSPTWAESPAESAPVNPAESATV